MGERESHLRALLHHQHGETFFVEFGQRVVDPFHHERSKTHGRLIKQQQLGFADERPPDGEHLLLAPGQRTGRLLAAPTQ